MNTATIKEIKEQLNLLSNQNLIKLCLRLARFKKENKELLTYLLFDSINEAEFVRQVKEDIDSQFETMKPSSFYYTRKSIRKTLSITKKYIRYSQKKETEVELLTHFCKRLKGLHLILTRNTAMRNLYNKQLKIISKAMASLHEDLQYDYQQELEELLHN